MLPISNGMEGIQNKDNQNIWNFVFALLYLGVFGAGMWWLVRVNGSLPTSINLFDFMLLILATFRLTRLFVYDKIMKFFEAQIFASLFEQTVFESQLAKFASRMTSLELRVENIKDVLKDVALEKEKVRHRIINKKQLETFSSMALWSQNG